MAGQIGVREGNSVVFHDCLLGDNISATIDIYSNYVEIVGVKFINPLHDHSIKTPSGNHIYIHDSSFTLNYEKKLLEGSGYWNPTFFTHEISGENTSLRKNYHFKNLKFKRKFQTILVEKNGTVRSYCESEPFTIYDEREKRKNNVSGDMVWENISFEGYSEKHQVVGYPNVQQTDEEYEALNYTNYDALSAQMKSDNNNSHGTYSVDIQSKDGTSKLDRSGVYSWGKNRDGRIDYPRDNRLFMGDKQEAISKPYIKMNASSVKDIYNSKIN